MKIHKVSASQLKCNFCLDWYITKNRNQPPNYINICQGCFTKGRGISGFKILDPINFEIYELHMKKTGIISDETRSVTTQVITELAEFYEKSANKQKVPILYSNLNELNTLENQLFESTSELRSFLSSVYQNEMERISKIWESATKDLETVSQLIDKQRDRMKQTLETYSYNVTTDLQRIFDTETFNRKLEELKNQASHVLNFKISEIKESYQNCPNLFFSDSFSLSKINVRSQTNRSMFELPDEYEKLEESIEIHKLYVPPTPQKQYKLNNQKTYKSATKLKAKKKVTINPEINSISCSVFDQENLLLDTPIPISKMTQEDKPQELTVMKQQQNMPRNNSSFGKSKKAENKSSYDFSHYDQLDFKSLKQQWPREQVRDLLNRKNPLPKGYKPHDEKPHIMRVYPERIMTSNICEALDKTFVGNNLIELIGYNTSSIEFLSYLGMLKWSERIQIVKFIGVHLTDENFNLTLCSIEKLRNVSTIVVSNNHLSDVSLEILLNFARQSQHIKTAYLGKNHINHFKSKAILQQLRKLGITVYV